MFRAMTVAIAASTAVTAPAADVGQTAPDFTARTFDGGKVGLADYRGKVLVINNWATWCGPCKAELPAMDAYYRRNAARGLTILAVTTEDSLPKYMLKKLAAVMAIPLANHLRGKDGKGYPAINGAVPTSYVIDRRGVVRYAKAGALTAASFAATLDPLLEEQ